jgi:N-acetylmuramoyl-L-alanine amidase
VPVVSALRSVLRPAIVLAALLALPAPALGARTERVGTSAQGRAITAVRVGSPTARRVVLVVGEIHGTERAGVAITRALRSVRPPRGTALLIVDRLNPDGAVARSRQNSRGVDLNRNFPFRWTGIGRPFDTYYPGPAPLSEPESLAASRFITRVRPRVTIWFHQMMRLVDRSGGDPFLERLYSRRSRLPYRAIAPLPGTATRWQNHTFPKDTAFVVELPAGRLSGSAVRRHVGAVRAVAGAVAPPRVVSRPIPFGARRKNEMRAYARRHYGIDDYHLRRPRVIVEHYTASNSFESAFSTFAADTPDTELHELPGVCAHYLIDRDGTIAQLVPTTIMCRHTVGLNQTAIGIEHVGTSDGQVLGDRRQLQASLRLTRMLQGRYAIKTPDVIGHAESLSSPYHRERVARLRRQTHGDFRRPTMKRYRRALSHLAAPRSLR